MSECCCLDFGKCSYFYFYLFGAIIINIIKKEFLKLDSFILNQFLLLRSIYQYVSYILFGLLFNWILIRSLHKEKNKKDNNNEINKRQFNRAKALRTLIYNNILKFPKKDIFSCIFVCFLYVLHFESLKIVEYFKLSSLNIWTAHIGFVIIFMNIYFPQNIYKHQLYPMIFVIFLDTILIIASTFLDYEGNKNIYQVKGIILCICLILFYICMAFIFSYAEVKTKILIDLKYLSPYIIIILIGIIGFTLNTIAALIFEIYGNKCNDISETNINCYSNVLSYFNKLKTIFYNTPKDFYLEIFFSLILMIFEFLNMTFEVFIYKYLNPSYLLFCNSIYFTFSHLINFFFIKKKFDSLSIKKFIFSEIAEIFELLVFPIYLELIELRFCGLNQNTRKNIMLRAESEISGEMNDTSLNNDLLNESDEKEKNIDMSFI